MRLRNKVDIAWANATGLHKQGPTYVGDADAGVLTGLLQANPNSMSLKLRDDVIVEGYDTWDAVFVYLNDAEVDKFVRFTQSDAMDV